MVATPGTDAETIAWLHDRLKIMEDNRQRDALRIADLERRLELLGPSRVGGGEA